MTGDQKNLKTEKNGKNNYNDTTNNNSWFCRDNDGNVSCQSDRKTCV